MLSALPPLAVFTAYPSFQRFWFARIAGTSANQMLMVALGWQIYDLTGSAWDLGLVGLLQFLPGLALMLVAGEVVDRHHRARVAAACVAVQALVAAVLAASPWTRCRSASCCWRCRSCWVR